MGHVLIAEDDSQLAHLWRVAFEQAGFTVELVYDGREALDYLQRYPLPDVLMVDEVMPYARGSQVLDRLFELDRNERVVTILTTAFSHMLETGQAQRVDYFLPKPMRFFDLARIARRLAVPSAGTWDSLQFQLA